MKKIFLLLFFMIALFISISFPVNAVEVIDKNSEEYLILFKSKKDKDEKLITGVGGKVYDNYSNFPIIHALLPKNKVKGLEKNPNILSIDLNVKGRIESSIASPQDTDGEDDPNFKENWGLIAAGATKSHTSGYAGEGVNIAVLDNGVDSSHPEFLQSNGLSRVKESVDCSSYIGRVSSLINCEKSTDIGDEHGTHVAGIAGGKTVGVANESNIYSLKVVDESGKPKTNYVIRALDWVIGTHKDSDETNNIDIVNMSLSLDSDKDEYFNRSLEEVLTFVYDEGVLLVSSSGNVRQEMEEEMSLYPARHPAVIAVGGIEIKDGKYTRAVNAGGFFTSKIGNEVQISAPGHAIYSSVPMTNGNSIYDKISGTSQAAPHVAGALAILRQQYPTPSSVGVSNKRMWNDKLKEMLRENAIPMNGMDDPSAPGLYGDYEYGAGMLQAIPYGKKGGIDLPLDSYKTFERPDEDSPSNIIISNGVYDYYQEWNNWYKIDDKEGHKVWIRLSEEERTKNNISMFFYETIPLTNVGYKHRLTGENIVDRVYWEQWTSYVDLDFSDIESRFDYYPIKEEYEKLKSRQNGTFYDVDKLNGEDHPFKDIVEHRRYDLTNQYNVVFEDAMGQTYFVPMWSHAQLAFDAEAQTITPKSSSFTHIDGHQSDDFTLYALKHSGLTLPEGAINLGYSWPVASVANTENLLSHNLIPDIERYLGYTNLSFVQVISNEEELLERSKGTRTDVSFRSDLDFYKNTRYYNSETGQHFQDRYFWRQHAPFVDLNYSDIATKFDYYPMKEEYEKLKSRQSGAFYDVDKFNGEDHPFKGTTDFQRYDLMNQYNVVFEDEMGQTYFLPMWSHGQLAFDVEAQTVMPASTDFVHIDGHQSDYFSLYALRYNSYTLSDMASDFGYYWPVVSVANDENLLRHNLIPDIEKYLGIENLSLISY